MILRAHKELGDVWVLASQTEYSEVHLNRKGNSSYRKSNGGLNSRLDSAKEKINKIQDTAIGIIQTEVQTGEKKTALKTNKLKYR